MAEDFLWLCESGWHECGRARMLLVAVDGKRICAVCWRRQRASADPIRTPQETKSAVEKSMQKRGGADRYRINAGKY